MELDELKNILSQAVDRETIQSPGFSLRDHQTHDPFRQIKKRCFWIFVFFGANTVIFSPFLFEKRNTLAIILYLTLSVEPAISMIGWLQIRSLEQTVGNIKQNLVLRIRKLQSIFRSYIFLNAFFYIILFSTLEYFISHQTDSLFGFEKVALPIRLLFYLFFIGFQYRHKRRSYRKHYGAYLSSMTQLLNQTHEE